MNIRHLIFKFVLKIKDTENRAAGVLYLIQFNINIFISKKSLPTYHNLFVINLEYDKCPFYIYVPRSVNQSYMYISRYIQETYQMSCLEIIP